MRKKPIREKTPYPPRKKKRKPNSGTLRKASFNCLQALSLQRHIQKPINRKGIRIRDLPIRGDPQKRQNRCSALFSTSILSSALFIFLIRTTPKIFLRECRSPGKAEESPVRENGLPQDLPEKSTPRQYGAGAISP